MSNASDAGAKQADGGYAVRVVSSISEFSRDEWNRLAGASKTSSDTPYNPFVSYDFLTIAEASGCAVTKTGWQGHHLRLETADGN